MTAWWAGLPAARTTLACGGETHRIAWSAGGLDALDHDDAVGERALAALAGERCACVELLDDWARHEDDLRVLTLASRGPVDPVLSDGAPRGSRPGPFVSTSGPVGWVSSSTGGSMRFGLRPGVGRRPPDDALVGLLGLGGDVPHRLQASVIAAWAERLSTGHDRVPAALPQLTAALHGRTSAGLRGWLGRPELAVEVELVDPGTTPELEWVAGGIRAALPFAWLEAVWARGLTSVMGHFCIDATSPDASTWTLSVVGPDLGQPETLTLTAGGGR